VYQVPSVTRSEWLATKVREISRPSGCKGTMRGGRLAGTRQAAATAVTVTTDACREPNVGSGKDFKWAEAERGRNHRQGAGWATTFVPSAEYNGPQGTGSGNLRAELAVGHWGRSSWGRVPQHVGHYATSANIAQDVASRLSTDGARFNGGALGVDV
jgi:hypothetical protein